jgi:hypothetical protein
MACGARAVQGLGKWCADVSVVSMWVSPLGNAMASFVCAVIYLLVA